MKEGSRQTEEFTCAAELLVSGLAQPGDTSTYPLISHHLSEGAVPYNMSQQQCELNMTLGGNHPSTPGSRSPGMRISFIGEVRNEYKS